MSYMRKFRIEFPQQDSNKCFALMAERIAGFSEVIGLDFEFGPLEKKWSELESLVVAAAEALGIQAVLFAQTEMGDETVTHACSLAPEVEDRIREWVWTPEETDFEEAEELRRICSTCEEAQEYADVICLRYPTREQWDAVDLTEEQNAELLSHLKKMQTKTNPEVGEVWGMAGNDQKVLVVAVRDSRLTVIPLDHKCSLATLGDLMWLRKHENRISVCFHADCMGHVDPEQLHGYSDEYPEAIVTSVRKYSRTLKRSGEEPDALIDVDSGIANLTKFATDRHENIRSLIHSATFQNI